MIYFLKENSRYGKVKIGYSNNIKKRLESLQVANSNELLVLLVANGGQRAEKGLHHKFKSLRVRGEWYKPAPELMKFIDEIKMAELDLTQPS